MGIKPDVQKNLSNLSILSDAKNNSRVKEPYWINNVTRLNETNMNTLRDNLIRYLEEALSRTYGVLASDIDEVIKRNAGWQQVSPEGRTLEEFGEIFSDYDNNEAKSNFSAAFGENNKVGENQPGQFIIGRYASDVEKTEDGVYALFIIGNGRGYIETTADTPQDGVTYYVKNSVDKYEAVTSISEFEEGKTYYELNRANALVVKTDGSVDFLNNIHINNGVEVTGTAQFNGKVSVKKPPTAKTHVVRKQELDELRSEISGALHYIGVVESAPESNATSVKIIYIKEDGTKGETEYSTTGTEYKLNSGDIVLVGTYYDTDPITSKKIEPEIRSEGNEFILSITDGICNWADYSSHANYVLTATYAEDQEKLRNDLEDEASERDAADIQLTNYINLLAKEDLVVNEPVFNVSWENIGSYEAGTVVNVGYAITFEDGQYKYPKNTSTEMGCTPESYSAEFNHQPLTGEEGTFNSVTVTSDTNLTATITAVYSDATTPVNKLGIEDPDYTHKSKSQEFSAKLKGYRQGCFYGTVDTDTDEFDVADIDSNVIRDLGGKLNANYSSTTKTMTVPIGATAILIACPIGEIGPIDVLNTTVNAKMTDLFGSNKIVKTLTVMGAGSDAGKEYNVWMYKPAVPYESTASLKITLG